MISSRKESRLQKPLAYKLLKLSLVFFHFRLLSLFTHFQDVKRIIWISWACGATAWFLRSVSVEEIVTVYHSAGDKEREGFALVSLAQHLLRNLVLNLSSLRIWNGHFFQIFQNLITKVWLVRQGKLSNLLWRESFCVETETQTRVGLLHPQAIMWLGRTSRPWRFFSRLRSRCYFFRELTADKIVLLVKCFESSIFINFQNAFCLIGKSTHIPTAWLWMSFHTHTHTLRFCKNFFLQYHHEL